MKIGERLEIEGQLVEVQKAIKTGINSCFGCWLIDKDCMVFDKLRCCSITREDAIDVIFKAVD